MVNEVVGSSYVEGVGDELLWVLGVGTITMATVLTSTVILLRQSTTTRQRINPQQLDNVEATRRQLGVSGGRELPPNDRNCPICLNEMNDAAIETNCGHIFCGTYVMIDDMLIITISCVMFSPMYPHLLEY